VLVYPNEFDVIVVGAGHAGIEAATAAARMGCRALLLTMNLDTIGQMSCNPAIGGLAKGHLVREIDALGGLMGENSDMTAIQCRMLNSGKGPAVQAPRHQCDKKAYQFRIKWRLEGMENLTLQQGSLQEITFRQGSVTGIVTEHGVSYSSRTVVLTTGTFLGGKLHIGDAKSTGGRLGDSVSFFTKWLNANGVITKRFKTGTPPRLNGRTIDFSKMETQPGDIPAPLFSFHPELNHKKENEVFSLNAFKNGVFHVEQLPCWLTRTTEKTAAIIRDYIHLSPLFRGDIAGVGPRYCPSIEDKIVKFPDKKHHHVFLEPEGLHTQEYYLNGCSTSLPIEAQWKFVRSIPGLENAVIIRPGYAVEYDYCPTHQLNPTLESKNIQGLFFAGQINGTSGYEEAAGQGLVAGINAAAKVLGLQPFIPERSSSYLGVMINDLITRDFSEPYRLFTSRAEYRLILRHDTADLRLSPTAIKYGLLTKERASLFKRKKFDFECLINELKVLRHNGKTLFDCLKTDGVTLSILPGDLDKKYSQEICALAISLAKYDGYIQRHMKEIDRIKSHLSKPIPSGIDYFSIPALKTEARLALHKIRPTTLDEASRIPAVTSSDLSILYLYV
jgi:tRNA uridine 5-carboxymethylaminomethyl modification enzyme